MKSLLRGGVVLLVLAALGCEGAGSPVGLENESEVVVDSPDMGRPLAPGAR